MTYEVMAEDKESEDHLYTAFGIRAVDSDGRVALSISDVFCHYEDAVRLVHRCNKGKLALVHLMDVVEDILEEAGDYDDGAE